MKRRIFLMLLGTVLMSGTLFAQSVFRHPGLLHSEADFEAVKARIAAGDATATEALAALRDAPPVRGDHGGNWAVNETIIRGVQGDNYMNAYRNCARAYQCALLWKITGEEHYADIAIDILNAYRIWNKGLGGNTNISLIPGFNGYQFLNAAEIMRDCPKWSKEDFELFKQYMIDVWFTVAQDFLERRHDTVAREQNWYHYHSNWGLGNALFCVSLGIFCDLPDIYNYGMYWLKEGPGNESLYVSRYHPDTFGQGLCGYGWGLIPWFHADERAPLGYFCQMQESGRDQGHSMAALGLLSYAFESAYNQGDNAFCNLNNSIVKGKAGSAMLAGAAEYVAAYNAGHDDLPYKTNWWMTGFGGTGRGQWRPIWQLFINHYQNRMGIPMKYCSEMKGIVGMEHGGGAYGHNSGGYDHTGWGDLMYNDAPVESSKVPTILFPSIAGSTSTRKFAEIRDVEPGTVLTLSASLPEGEQDTGNWKWEDGVIGSQRQITADHSGLYRLFYTNANGVESTQLFSIAVKGEGIKGSLTATYTYNGLTKTLSAFDTETDVLMGEGRRLSMTTAYTNWNYITSEEWYDETGKRLSTSGTYSYTLKDMNPHKLIFRLTNQSGVVLEKVFNIIPNENELTSLLPDPECRNLEAWTMTPGGFALGTASVGGFSSPYIERIRDAVEDGYSCWGQEPFCISQTMEGLKAGKYELSASVVATQQSKTGAASKHFVKDVYLFAEGANTAVSSEDGISEYFSVQCYVGADGKMTYGVKNVSNQNKAYSENGMNWFAMDNLCLVYHGDAEVAADLADMRREVAAISEDMVTPALYKQLTDLANLTADDVETAVAYQQVLGEVRMLQTHYAEYMEAYKRYREYVTASQVTDATLTTALEEFASAGTAEEFFNAYENLLSAWKLWLTTSETSVKMNEFLPEDGELKSSGTDVMYDNVTRWMTDAEGGNFRIFAIDGSDTERGEATGENMIERFCGANFYANQRVIYTPMVGMPVGRYVFKAAAQKNSEAGVIELFANSDAIPVMSVKTMQQYEVVTEVYDGKLVLGVRAGENNGSNWTSMADVDLEYYSPLMLLQEALEASSVLNYGTDKEDALGKAVQEAETMLSSGDGNGRMAAYHALLDAMDQYRLDNASPEHPVDLTKRMKNAGFDSGNKTGWIITVTDAAYPKISQGVVEFWHTDFDIRQKVVGLPIGNYRASVQARSDAGVSNKNFRMYVTSTGSAPIYVYCAGQTRADGTDVGLHLGQNAKDLNADAEDSRISTNSVFVGDGQLTIGALCDDASMWCILNDFRLEYLGMEANNLMQHWLAQVAIAGAMNRELLPQAVEVLVDNAAAVDVTGMDDAGLSEALSALMAEIDNAQKVMVVYEEYLAKKKGLEDIVENSIPKQTFTLDLLKSSIDTESKNAELAATPKDMQAVLSALESARRSYVMGATPINGLGFDYTFNVLNPACNSDGSWLHDGTVNFRTLVNTAQNGEYAEGVFYENWIGPGNELKDGRRPIYQTVESLPNGNYELTAAAFRKVELSSAATEDMNVSLYLNGQETEVTSEVLDYFTVNGAVSSRTAEFGLKGGSGNTANWVGLADVSLFYYGVQASELDETSLVFDVQDGQYGDVTVLQRLNGWGWNLICLPFDLNYRQARTFKDVKAFTGIEMDGDVCNLKFEDVREIKAGLPYLVKMDTDTASLTFSGVVLDAYAIGENVVEVSAGTTEARLTGTSCVTTLEGGYVYVHNGNAFVRAEVGQRVNGFRVFLELNGVIPSVLNVYVDGELVTDVQEVKAESSSENVDVYTVDGKCLRQGVPVEKALFGLDAGIYIVNGKKMVK